MTDRIDLAAAAERLGVHYQTAYRWVREGRLPAVRVRGRYEIEVVDVDALAAARDAPKDPVGPRPGRRDWDRLAERAFVALRDGDERTATDVVVRLCSQQESIVDVIERVLVPALVRIGEEWSTGDLSIAEEHRASAIVERILVAVDQRRAGRPRGKVAIAATAGDQHGLPVAMAGAVLRADGWTVELLGRDLPEEAIMTYVETDEPDLVVLTVTNPELLAPARKVQGRLEDAGQAALVGGPGRSLSELLQLARAHTRAARSTGP